MTDEERAAYNAHKAEHMKKLLKPYAELFRVNVDYKWDGPQELLVIDGTEICCGHNSEADVMEEFIGYIFLRMWRQRSLGAFDKQVRNYIRYYWKEKPSYMPALNFIGSHKDDYPGWKLM